MEKLRGDRLVGRFCAASRAKLREIADWDRAEVGSPALLMKAARFRLGASENPQGNQGRQLC